MSHTYMSVASLIHRTAWLIDTDTCTKTHTHVSTGSLMCHNPKPRQVLLPLHPACAALCIELAPLPLCAYAIWILYPCVRERCALSHIFLASFCLAECRELIASRPWLLILINKTSWVKNSHQPPSSLSLSLNPSHPLALNSSPSPSHPPLLHCSLPLKWGDLWLGDSFLSKSGPRKRGEWKTRVSEGGGGGF